MKKIKKIVSVVLVLASMLVATPLNAFAASKTWKPTASGTSYYFAISPSSTGTCKLNFTTAKGSLEVWDWGKTAPVYSVSVYGSYEIKIHEGTKTGKVIYDEDIYCSQKGSASFKAEKGKIYYVQIYFWRVSTTAESYAKWKKIDVLPQNLYKEECSWLKYPSITCTY